MMKKLISIIAVFMLLLLTSCLGANTPNIDDSSESMSDNSFESIINNSSESTSGDSEKSICDDSSESMSDDSSESMSDDNMDKKNEEYSAMILSGVESGVFKNSFILPASEAKEEVVNDTPKSTIRLGIHEVDAYQTKIIYTDRTIRDEYRSESWDYIYQIDRNSNSFVIQAENDAVLQEYSFKELTEENLLQQVTNFIKNYLPSEKIESYTLSCSTRIIVKNPDSSWGENKGFFYQANKEANETVLYYACELRLFNQGLKTPNSIAVRCNGNGDITSIVYTNYGIDWDSVAIEINNIRQQATAFVSDAISDEYSLLNCSFLSESFDYVDSKIRVIVECELTLTHKGYDNIVVLCPVIITP